MKNMFQGETLTCYKCGWKYTTSGAIESMWTIVQIDDREILCFCPRCWGIPRHLWPDDVKEKFDRDKPPNRPMPK